MQATNDSLMLFYCCIMDNALVDFDCSCCRFFPRRTIMRTHFSCPITHRILLHRLPPALVVAILAIEIIKVVVALTVFNAVRVVGAMVVVVALVSLPTQLLSWGTL